MTDSPAPRETTAVIERYARRGEAGRYSLLKPDVWQTLQERQRVLLGMLADRCDGALSDLRVLEVGCGTGGNLLDFLRLGCSPEHLRGVELLPERLEMARRILPERVTLLGGDASTAPVEPASVDLVVQFTVFSSLLDDQFQQQLAREMWRWVRPGGAVLWYDFVYDNPSNPDVRGVPLRRVKSLFPEGAFTARRVTLAPPISRRVCRAHPALYTVFNAVPWLRTHLLCWIQKP